MKIIKTIKSGPVEISVRQFSDARFGFDWEESGKRKQGRWRDESDAIEAAKTRAKVLAAGRINLLDVDPQELAEFRAWKASRAKSKTVAEIRDELLALKEEDSDLDAVYVTNLKGAWMLFCDCFGKRNIADVSPSEIEAWLRDLKRSPRTRNNLRDSTVQLFRFARQREYLPDSITAAEKVQRLKIKTRSDDIEIWTPEEMRLLLRSIDKEFLPWVLFGGFAGIRTEEICPNVSSRKDALLWEDIQWSEKQIMVRAETAKTERTRFIPLSENLIAWLQPYRSCTGRVINRAVNTLYNEVKHLRKRLRADIPDFEFKKNALRHSFGSYRNALIRNIGQLSDEMGNSPAIAKRNYERPQPRAIAEEWFAISPDL